MSRVFDPSRYLSGEDPFLGYHLAQPAVAGIQSNRVIANAKHFVNNNQETNRNTVLEIVDERTRYEMYYPPFEGAANAGVGSVMCSCRWHVTVLCSAIVRPKLDSYFGVRTNQISTLRALQTIRYNPTNQLQLHGLARTP